MKSLDKKHIKAVNLWASNIIDQIQSNKDFNASMQRQIKRNEIIMANDQEQLDDCLIDHNKWRKKEGYPIIKKYPYIK